MHRTLLTLAGAAALTVLAGVTPAKAWDQVAERIVTDRLDIDNIMLPGPRHYSRLRVCVYGNPVAFYDFDIFFKNGGHQDVAVRARINPGDCTRVIDLEGGRRNINRIQFKYEETSWFVGRAVVKVFAE